MRHDLTPCLIFPILEIQAGGLTNAVRRRANFYAQHFAKVVIFTTEFQADFPSVIAEMRDNGQLAPEVTVRNFYYHYSAFREGPASDGPTSTYPSKDDLVMVPEQSGPEVAYRYFTSTGEPLMVQRYANGQLRHVDHLDSTMRRVARDEYLEDGHLIRRRQFAPASGESLLATYFTESGVPLATAKLNPRSGAAGRAFAFRPEAEDLASFNTLISRWIDEEIAPLPRPTLSSDQRGRSDPVLLGVQGAARRVAVLHNNHFNDPMDPASGVRNIFANLFDRAGDLDKIVVLTQEQLADLEHDYPTLPFTHIGHAAPPVAEQDGHDAKDPNLVVMVAQLIERKRIDHAIRAFRFVVGKHPAARLEIFGEGALHSELQSLIEELELTDSVSLMGYSRNVGARQRQAVCSVLTSTFEGSPLVLGESMANGTPVVAYSIKYGPRDWIRHGIDGLLVDEHEPEALGAAIASLLADPVAAEDMASRSRDVSDRFSIDEYEKKWLAVLE
jgi:glycosyltransferase involved in cell wall biosynthesis